MLWLLFACTEPEKEFDSDPPTRWKAVYGGDGVMCGIKLDGSTACWGPRANPENYFYDSDYIDIPPGKYIQIAMSGGELEYSEDNSFGTHGCGILEDQSVVCWGGDSYGETIPTISTAISVAVYHNTSCGVTLEGILACWGAASTVNSSYSFVKVQVGYDGICSLTETHELPCINEMSAWNDFIDIHIHIEYMVALRQNGSLIVLENAYSPQEIISDRTYTKAVIYDGSTDYIICGIDTDGALDCFGSGDPGEYEIENVPSGTFTSVAISETVGCAVDTDAMMHCWGYDPKKDSDWNPLMIPPPLVFASGP